MPQPELPHWLHDMRPIRHLLFIESEVYDLDAVTWVVVAILVVDDDREVHASQLAGLKPRSIMRLIGLERHCDPGPGDRSVELLGEPEVSSAGSNFSMFRLWPSSTTPTRRCTALPRCRRSLPINRLLPPATILGASEPVRNHLIRRKMRQISMP